MAKDKKDLLRGARKRKGKQIWIVECLEDFPGQALHVNEIAQKVGMFPSDVEQALKDLDQDGAVECFMYKHKLYATFKKGVASDRFKRGLSLDDDPMVR